LYATTCNTITGLRLHENKSGTPQAFQVVKGALRLSGCIAFNWAELIGQNMLKTPL
jgi:hypothetical protein